MNKWKALLAKLKALAENPYTGDDNDLMAAAAQFANNALQMAEDAGTGKGKGQLHGVRPPLVASRTISAAIWAATCATRGCSAAENNWIDLSQ